VYKLLPSPLVIFFFCLSSFPESRAEIFSSLANNRDPPHLYPFSVYLSYVSPRSSSFSPFFFIREMHSLSSDFLRRSQAETRYNEGVGLHDMPR
jgi:hypothetical protein